MHHILIVDEDPVHCELASQWLRQIFAQTSVNITCLSMVQDAQVYLRENLSVNAVLCDYRLPDGMGIELVRSPLSPLHDLPYALLVVTHAGHEEVALQAWQAGCHGYLNKQQLTLESLQIAVLDAIEKVRLKRELQEQIVALRQAKNEAEKAHEVKRRFLESVGPEIQTPLRIILEYATLLDEHRYLPNAMRSEALAAIKRNADLVSRLFESVSQVHEVSTTDMTIESSLIKPEELIEQVFSLYRQRAFSAGLSLILRRTKEIPSCIKSDPLRLKQVLIGLLEYALKNTRTGGVTLYLHVLNHISTQDVILEFNVLFNPENSIDDENFFDDPNINIANIIAEKLGGGVTLKASESRHFTCIATHIRAPVVRWVDTDENPYEMGHPTFISQDCETSDQMQATLEKGQKNIRARLAGAFKANESGDVDIRGVSVLVGEDSPETQFLIKKFLEIKGAQVELAKTGLEVVGKALEKSFDVLLLDIQLPEMDGFEATRELRRMGFFKPIIALTAVNLNEVRERCLLGGFDSYLTKPIHPKVLFAAIARQVHKGRSMASHYTTSRDPPPSPPAQEQPFWENVAFGPSVGAVDDNLK